MNQLTNKEINANWEIIPACDIRLGEIFGPNGSDKLFAGRILSINTKAIQETLEHLGPGSKGTLLFTAVHPNHFNNGELGTADRPIKTGEQHVVCLDVITPLDLAFKGYPHSTQETAVHELRHVVDQTNPKLVKAEMKYRREHLIKAFSAYYGILGSAAITASGIAYEVTSSAQESGIFSLYTASCAGALSVLGLIPRAREMVRKRLNHTRLNSPLEKRADAAEEIAFTLPQIVEIK